MKMATYSSSPSDGMTKVEELYTHVKRYCLHKALAELGIVGMKIFRNDPSVAHLYPSAINEFKMTFLAKALILNSNDHRREDFGDSGLFKSANLFSNLYEKFIDTPDNSSPEQKAEALQSFLIRISNQQFPSQLKVGNLIPRTLYLFQEIPNSLEKPTIDISAEIESIYGLNLKQIIAIGFAILASSEHGYLDPQYLTNTKSPELKKYLDTGSVQKLINIISADYNKLRELFLAEEGEEGFQQYAFNVLRTFPLVKTQIAGLVIPIPRFVLERITDGIYYSLVNKFHTVKSNPFLEFFGKEIFERYVGILFSEIYKENLIKEFEYKKGKKVIKTPDWIIIEDDEAIVVECKTSGITKAAKSWGDVEKIESDLKSRAIHAIIQMSVFVDDFKKGLVQKKELKGIKKFRFIVVTYDRIFMSGTPIIRGFIDKELLVQGIKNADYQVIGIDEVEKLTPLRTYAIQ